MKVIEFKSEHLQRLLAEPAVLSLKPFFPESVTKAMERAPFVASVEHNGAVVFCGGVAEYWPGRGEAFAFYDRNVGRNFVPLFRIIKDWIDKCPVRRIEASVELDSPFAHRHVMLMGFELEAPRMRAFSVDGKDCSLYAKVKS